LHKKWLLIPIVSVSFILMLTLGILLNIVPQGAASGETNSGVNLSGVEALNTAFVEVSKTVKPSVVNISTTSVVKRQRDPVFWEKFQDLFRDDFPKFFQERQSQTRKSLGSGVIVKEDGYILTNYHVVQDADDIKVTLTDKREFDAKLMGADKYTELAVIKIDEKDLPSAKLGDSDKLQVGEWVLAIGNPFRLSHTVTAGIISATGRSDVLDPEVVTYQDFIQTDASINPGNSGGPLVNVKGEVVGINTAIALAATAEGVPVQGNVGIGFAVPINMALDVMDQLIEKGKVVRGWLGIQFQEVSGDIAEKYGIKEPGGALIVSAGGPAKKAGLKPGDLIVEFDDKTVEDGSHLKKLVAAVKPGETIKIKVIRDGKNKEFKVKLAERTDEAMAELGGRGEIIPGEEKEEWLGVTVQGLTEELAQRLGYEGLQGVLISDVDADGPAAKVDNAPRRGDLIQEIEGQEIKNMDDYRRAAKEVKDEESVMIRLRRARGGTWYVVIKKGK